MKKVFFLVLLLALALLAGCGNGDPKNGFKKPPGNYTAPRKPYKAEGPAALNRKDVANATGVTETWVDPENGKTCTVVEDRGADGYSLTNNCYDEGGSLVWWECFEYGEKSEISAVERRKAGTNALIFRKEYNRNEWGIDRMVYYEPFGGGTDAVQIHMVYSETYFLNHSVHLHTEYYPFETYLEYYKSEEYEYVPSGEEIRHETYEPGGPERTGEVKLVSVPDTLQEMFERMNGASVSELDAVLISCKKRITEKNMTEAWDEFVSNFSAYVDLYNGNALSVLRDEYKLGLLNKNQNNNAFYRPETSDMQFLKSYVYDGKVSAALRERVYRKNGSVDLGGTIWLGEEYRQAVSAVGTVREHEEGERIRILVVENSATYMDIDINGGFFVPGSDFSKAFISRTEKIINVLFREYTGKVVLTSYPQDADVVLEITTEYPLHGRYRFAIGAETDVYDTILTMKAVDRHNGRETSVRFENIAPQNVTSDKIVSRLFMLFPNVEAEVYKDRVQEFTQSILGWFPDVK